MAHRSFLLRIGITLLSLGAALPAHAAATPQDAFNQLTRCVQTEDVQTCRTVQTSDSLPLYDRFASYGLLRCLPKDATYVSQEAEGNAVVVRARVTQNEKPRIMRLVFTQEAGGWKLDTPESLRRGMGENWQKQVNMTEQLYLMMRTQMGGQLNCAMIHALAGGKGTVEREIPCERHHQPEAASQSQSPRGEREKSRREPRQIRPHQSREAEGKTARHPG